MEWITLLAILVGPVFAILVSRHLEHRKENRIRKMDVFRTLMRTRRTPIHPDHVGALNLVEIEFSDDTEVVKSLKLLFAHFGTPHGRRPEEETDDKMTKDEMYNRDDRFHARLGSERQALLAKLLHGIARNLGFKIEQLEIFEGGYSPQGWHDVDREQQFIRRYIVEMAMGRRQLPISIVEPDEGSN